MPVMSAQPVVTKAHVLFSFAHGAAGAADAPGIPCALLFEGQRRCMTRAHRAARRLMLGVGKGHILRHACSRKLPLSLRAQRSNPSRRNERMDCFVATLLAMTDPPNGKFSSPRE